MTIKQIAEQAKVPRQRVYYILRKLGRVPTVDEVINYHSKVGRPSKYKLIDTATNSIISIGTIVRFVNEEVYEKDYKNERLFYPPTGTIGVVKGVNKELNQLLVKWKNYDICSWHLFNDVEVIEYGKYN